MSNEILKQTFDVAIIGGGTAGAFASLESLDHQLKVIIIEKSIGLGGSMSNALVSPMMPSYARNTSLVLKVQSLIEEYEKTSLKVEGNSFWFNAETLKFILEQEILKRNGLILYDCILSNVQLNNDLINQIEVISLDQKIAIKAKCFIDCSGDAILASLARIPTIAGDEITHKNQATSFRFEMGGVDITKLRLWSLSNEYTFNPCTSDQFFEFVHVPFNKACGKLLEIFQAGIDSGEILAEDARYVQGFSIPTKPGTLSFNGPQLKNDYATVDVLGKSIYVSQGRVMQQRLLRFLKKNIPGFEKAYIAQEAHSLGVRESKRIIGQYVLNKEDYLKRAKFEDGIVAAVWYIDVHSDDINVEKNQFKAKFEPYEYYEIPYRCLVAHEVKNYIAAGRHISTTFEVQSSIRIQYTVANMGVKAAQACAYSLIHKIPLNEINGKVLKESLEAK
ncbi:MAG: FAD-dependent oxidoreductase [Bacilli bacterium]